MRSECQMSGNSRPKPAHSIVWASFRSLQGTVEPKKVETEGDTTKSTFGAFSVANTFQRTLATHVPIFDTKGPTFVFSKLNRLEITHLKPTQKWSPPKMIARNYKNHTNDVRAICAQDCVCGGPFERKDAFGSLVRFKPIKQTKISR